MLYTFVKDNYFVESMWIYGSKNDLMSMYNKYKNSKYMNNRLYVHHYDNNIPCFLQIKNNYNKGTTTFNFYDVERGIAKAFENNLFDMFRGSGRFETEDFIKLAKDVEWYLIVKDSLITNPMKHRIANDYMYRKLVIEPIKKYFDVFEDINYDRLNWETL